MESRKTLIIAALALVLAAALFFFFSKNDTSGKVIIPYISHQLPQVDPHLPSSKPLSDKLDEVLFDGLFNVKATPSGVVYEDGLAELISNQNREVTLRLKKNVLWHSSYKRWVKDDELHIEEGEKHYFTANDLAFTIDRIRRLASLSPDYVLINQALNDYRFSEPDENNEIRFRFNASRGLWRDDDIKEIFSFKIIPKSSEVLQKEYVDGTASYIFFPSNTEMKYFQEREKSAAAIPSLRLYPVIDNSTYLTELLSNNINIVLNMPFGALSPILDEEKEFFTKSNISTTFFALFFNTKRVSLEKRRAYRAFINNKAIQSQLYKRSSKQQRHITDYKGNRDNYDDYLNFSLFPKTTIYVSDKIISENEENRIGNPNLLDSLDIKVCLNYGFREELSEIANIMNDPSIGKGKLKVTAVRNDVIKDADYDALLIPISGYRSNYLFDVYSIFLRKADLSRHDVSVSTTQDSKINPSVMNGRNNFFQLNGNDAETRSLLENIYGFMSSKDVYDKTVYAQMLHDEEQKMALGVWLFSLPSLSYFSRQFDEKSVNLYGVASQLSTIDEWKERKED